MVTAAPERPMAKKKLGRPNAGRDDVTAKIDRTIAFRAKQIAGHRGVPVSEVLSEACRANIDKAYAEFLKAHEKS